MLLRLLILFRLENLLDLFLFLLLLILLLWLGLLAIWVLLLGDVLDLLLVGVAVPFVRVFLLLDVLLLGLMLVLTCWGLLVRLFLFLVPLFRLVLFLVHSLALSVAVLLVFVLFA